jgi:hypothetical protein
MSKLREQIIMFFARMPDEVVSVPDLALKTNAQSRPVLTAVKGLWREGLLDVRKEVPPGRANEYCASDKLLKLLGRAA